MGGLMLIWAMFKRKLNSVADNATTSCEIHPSEWPHFHHKLVLSSTPYLGGWSKKEETFCQFPSGSCRHTIQDIKCKENQRWNHVQSGEQLARLSWISLAARRMICQPLPPPDWYQLHFAIPAAILAYPAIPLVLLYYQLNIAMPASWALYKHTIVYKTT